MTGTMLVLVADRSKRGVRGLVDSKLNRPSGVEVARCTSPCCFVDMVGVEYYSTVHNRKTRSMQAVERDTTASL